MEWNEVWTFFNVSAYDCIFMRKIPDFEVKKVKTFWKFLAASLKKVKAFFQQGLGLWKLGLMWGDFCLLVCDFDLSKNAWLEGARESLGLTQILVVSRKSWKSLETIFYYILFRFYRFAWDLNILVSHKYLCENLAPCVWNKNKKGGGMGDDCK